jgi:sugar O-acyltransferase (sialic acid O-acetyltransferase NeuD family)
MKNVALIGYSGHALVVADVLKQSGYKIIGYFEKVCINKNPLHLKYLGYEQDYNFTSKFKKATVFPAVGDNNIRERIMTFITERKIEVAVAISTQANISHYATIGQGTLVCRGACINPYAVIGKGVIINTGAIIEHECVIADFVHIAPGAVLAGNVNVGENSFVGANAIVKQGIRIGINVTIGAGAVVLKDVPDNEIWIGNPAKRLRK